MWTFPSFLWQFFFIFVLITVHRKKLLVLLVCIKKSVLRKMKNFAVSFGDVDNRINQNVGNIHSSNAALSSGTKTNFTSTPNNSFGEDKDTTGKKNKHPYRKAIDAFTVIAYATLITAAVAMNKVNPTAAKKGTKAVGELAQKAAEAKGGPLYRLFNYFGKLKKNSEELTNNLVYGFGTLVVMPLVIMFSPFGKKDATKEDRFFTILRQPISFATLFAMQLTFDKIFKSLVGNLNKYKLLDGIKGKDGKDLYFRREQSIEDIKHALENFHKYSLRKKKYYFNPECLNDPHYKKEMDIIKEHFPKNANRYDLKEFLHCINAITIKMGAAPHREHMDHFNKLFNHYIKQAPQFAEKLDSLVYTGSRGRALKEFSVVIANSILSQALGIMMLNFIYGKMMKQYTKHKENSAQKADSVEGGGK